MSKTLSLKPKDPLLFAFLVALVVWFCVGCSTRTITYGGATYRSMRLGTKEDINALTIKVDTNGTTRVNLDGYKNDQAQAMSAVVEAAVKAAVGK